MKSILPYILLMTGTLVGAVAIIVGVYQFKPSLLGIAPKAPPAVASKDSAAVRDTSSAKRLASAAVPSPDSTLVGPPAPPPKQGEAAVAADSIRTLLKKIDDQQKLIADLTGKAPKGSRTDSTARETISDSARAKDSKSFAKMLEGMPADQAVRILKGLDDREVKAVLLTVKKRQAAKILSALDPERAARMMRTLE